MKCQRFMKRPSLHRKALAALSPRHGDTKSPPHAPRGGIRGVDRRRIGHRLRRYRHLAALRDGSAFLWPRRSHTHAGRRARRRIAGDLDHHDHRRLQIRHLGIARAKRRRRRRIRALRPFVRAKKTRHDVLAVVADAGSGTAVRRRHHHAGDQRAIRGRGAAGGDAGVGPHRHPDHGRASDRAVRHPVQRHVGHRYRVRSDSRRLVCRHRRARRAGRSNAASGNPRGLQSGARASAFCGTPACSTRSSSSAP